MIKTYLKKVNLLFIIVLLTFPGCSGNENRQKSVPESGLLWKITGNTLKSPSYLFGTFHKEGGMQILDSIQSFDSIFASTKQLICEIDLMNAPKLLRKNSVNSDRFFKPWPAPDSTYENLLNEEQKHIIDSAINKDASLQIIIDWNIRPSKAISTIKYSYNRNCKNDMSSDNYSITPDGYLQQLANKYKMDIIELDSNEAYHKITDSLNSYIPQLSYRSEADLLIYFIQNYRDIDSLQNDYKNKLLSTYLLQEINLFKLKQKAINKHSRIITSFLENENFTELQKKLLIDERNNMWMDKIPNLIKDNSSFIAVGAGHLGGEEGLINQLRKLNYSVVSMNKTKN